VILTNALFARAVPAGRDEAGGLSAASLHEHYLDAVFRYVSRRVARREDAEDITAEVFAAAFVMLPRYRGDVPPYPWLLGIARRKIADSYRRRKYRPEALSSEIGRAAEAEALLESLSGTEEGADAALYRSERREAVRALLAGLKEEQREVLLLQYVEGLSQAEIAAVVGKSVGAVNSLLQRARAAMFRQGREFFLNEEAGNGKA